MDAAWVASKERRTRTIDADHVVMPLPRSFWRRLGRASLIRSCSPAQGREPAELAEMEAAGRGEARCRRDAARLATNFGTMLGVLGTPAWLRWPHGRGDVTTSAIAF